MKKGMCLLLSGMMVLSIAACGANGGGTSGSSANSHSDAVLSDEELIASAQNIYIGDFERTLGEYMEAATEVPQKSWYVVSEETADSDTLDELEDLYDPDEERPCFVRIFHHLISNFTLQWNLLRGSLD